jgi:hypothetical protein
MNTPGRRPTPQPVRDCGESVFRESHAGLSCTANQKTLQRKSYSVADLRKVFERGSQPNTEDTGTSASAPSTPKPAYHMKIEVLAELAVDFEGVNHRRHSKADGRSGNYEGLKAAQAPVQDTYPRSRPCVVQCSKDTSVRRSDEKSIESGARDELSQSIGVPVRQPVKLSETSHQSPARTPDSTSSSSPQLLLSRTLSVKAYTIRPASQGPLRHRNRT